jgi:hypothetical protein
MLLYFHSLDASVPSNWLPYIDVAWTYKKYVSRARMYGAHHIETTASSLLQRHVYRAVA